MKRPAHPSLSTPGQEALASYERWLCYLVKKYACLAHLPDVSPHDLQQAVETIAWR